MIYLLLNVIILIVSGISLAYYIKGRREMNAGHVYAMSELTPVRHLEQEEIRKFKTLYKRDITHEGAVYRFKDDLITHTTTVNGATSYEYTVGDIKLHTRSVNILAKHADGVDINNPEITPEIEKEVEKLNEQLDKKEISKIVYSQKVRDLINPTVEFVFLKRDKLNKPAYIVGYNDWNLSAVQEY